MSFDGKRTGKKARRSKGKKQPTRATTRINLETGEDILLAGGKNNKQKFNGKLARIVLYPNVSSWMTVQVGTNQMKWRKGGYKITPFEILNEQATINIFSFLGGGDTTEGNLWVKDAARIHSKLSSVCRSWKETCDRNLSTVVGRLNADFDALPNSRVIPCIFWLTKYRLSLGSLKFTAELADIPLLDRLLTECQTDHLTIVKAYLGEKDRSSTFDDFSPWISEAYQFYYGLPQEIDLTGGIDLSVSQAEKARALGIPAELHSQRYFQDIMASLCPNITDLAINLTIQPGRWITSENASTLLFSMPTISKLKLSFGVSCRGQSLPFDGMFISKVIKNLTVLRELTLATRSAQELYSNRFHVESPTLRILDVQGLTKHVWISCKCPRLERFLCKGGLYGNGSRPASHPPEQTIHNSSSGIYLYAGAVPFGGLEIPNDCMCIFVNHSMLEFDSAVDHISDFSQAFIQRAFSQAFMQQAHFHSWD
jgi:hypothetical protein